MNASIEQVEEALNQAQITLESIRYTADMLADALALPEGPIANGLKHLAEVASGQISQAMSVMKNGLRTEVAS